MRNVAFAFVVLLVSCAQMKRDWEAQQQQNAAAAAAAQPANMEALCKSVVNAYCPRCNIDQAGCGQTYIACLGNHSPADPSAFNMGQVDQCSAEVQAGDCNVMPSVWPASCSTPTTPSCSGGSTWDGAQCACPGGTAWDGNQCAAAATTGACRGGALWDAAQNQCVCTGGAAWDGSQCACAAGTGWNGSQCVATGQPRRVHCREALLDKGYGPDQLGGCKGVNERCAVAAIARGYGPDQLGACRNVDGACAEGLLNRGYGVDQLGSCRR